VAKAIGELRPPPAARGRTAPIRQGTEEPPPSSTPPQAWPLTGTPGTGFGGALPTLVLSPSTAPGAGVIRHTEYMGLAVGAEVLARISPARGSAVTYYDSITVDHDRERPGQVPGRLRARCDSRTRG